MTTVTSSPPVTWMQLQNNTKIIKKKNHLNTMLLCSNIWGYKYKLVDICSILHKINTEVSPPTDQILKAQQNDARRCPLTAIYWRSASFLWEMMHKFKSSRCNQLYSLVFIYHFLDEKAIFLLSYAEKLHTQGNCVTCTVQIKYFW